MQKLTILYQDAWLVIIHKPSGLLSVSFEGNRSHTAQQMVEDLMRKNGSFSVKHKPFAVHRLDRDTSGVMMFALGETAQQKIMNDWHHIVTERLYRAVAENPSSKQKTLPDTGCIDEPLAFNTHNRGYVPRPNEIVKTVPARTNYTVIARGKTHTLFELSLDTGKKNQIRAHLASKGYPLAGDGHYRAHTNPFGRLALHARTLAFLHPFLHKEMRFEVPEPADWQSFVTTVQKGTTSAQAQKKHQDYSLTLGKKRLSRKDKAHLDFIEQGKRQSKK